MRLFCMLTVFMIAMPVVTPKERRHQLSWSEKKAAQAINAERLRGYIRFLASDLLEGRGPASRGEWLAITYIAAQMEALGLEPGAPGGGWLQTFDIVRIISNLPKKVMLTREERSLGLSVPEEMVISSGVQREQSRVHGAEVVFVGYGIVAPEYDWDDYKGANLQGKVLLMMNNDPEDDPKLFGGKTRQYYGRWTYKYEIAAQKGAVGAIIIHTRPSASYPWQVVQTSWGLQKFSLPDQGTGPRLEIEAWTTEEASKRIARLGGQDLDSLCRAAQKKDFRPVPLGVKLNLRFTNDVQRMQTANVIGRIQGSDPKRSKEVIIYTAHHDHLGKKRNASPGEDAIFNGALDNASGVASVLAIAQAVKSLPKPPKRSILFATVAAEEQGLLGSKYLAEHPPVSPGRMAANINIDTLNIIGKTRDLISIGLGRSSVDVHLHALAKELGRNIVPDPYPDRGTFYRSDQYNLAKIGVPVVYLGFGDDVIGKPIGWGKQQRDTYVMKHYHQPSDELSDHWEYSGAVEDSRFFFYLGLRLANLKNMPSWRSGDEFEAAREAALKALKH